MGRPLNASNVVALFAPTDDVSDVPASLRRAPKAAVPPTVASKPPKRKRSKRKPKPEPHVGLTTSQAHWIHVRLSAGWHLLQWGVVTAGAYHFAGPVLGFALSTLIVGTSFAVGLGLDFP